MLKTFLLFLSRNEFLKGVITNYEPAKRFSKRFVAGETWFDAINAVEELNSKGIVATIDCLGENVVSVDGALRAADNYIEILDKINETGVKANVSLKLTQMGLDVDIATCVENLERILEKAKEHDNFVRIDMEGSKYTEDTLLLFKEEWKKYGNVGAVIQSHLYRSRSDLEELIELGAPVRLCKGAYKEPSSIAYPKKRDVDKNYVELMRMLLGWHAMKCKNVYPAIATHDEKILNCTKERAKEIDINPSKFEFQMLYGIRRDLQEQLVNEGYTVRVYVPFGEEWYPYFMRRLAERPANLLFLMKNLFRD